MDTLILGCIDGRESQVFISRSKSALSICSSGSCVHQHRPQLRPLVSGSAPATPASARDRVTTRLVLPPPPGTSYSPSGSPTYSPGRTSAHSHAQPSARISRLFSRWRFFSWEGLRPEGGGCAVFYCWAFNYMCVTPPKVDREQLSTPTGYRTVGSLFGERDEGEEEEHRGRVWHGCAEPVRR